MRQAGKTVKRWWFVRRAKHILNKNNHDYEFQFSNWFSIALRNFRIGTTFHFEERLTAYKKAPSTFLDCK